MKPTKTKTGRPSKEIDLQKVEDIVASSFCTAEEVAAECGINYSTLNRREGGAEAFEKGANRAKASLRRRQFEVAMGRDAMPAEYMRDKKGDLVLQDGMPILLRAEQERVAPSIAMLIWLGKQHLGQSDKFHFDADDGMGFAFVKNGKTKE